MLLAEIQQTSDTTYRIYDWDRLGVDGVPRELHTEDAIEAIDFTKYNKYKTDYNVHLNTPSRLVNCDKFTTNILEFNKLVNKDIESLDSFIIYISIEGETILVWDDGEVKIGKGEAVLVPAYLSQINLVPKSVSRLLEVYI
jgi:mannose-6-phosphate isomerase